MVVGLLQVEVHLPVARSLKDKRSVLKSLKDQLRGRFNVAVAELDASEKWQRARIGVASLGEERTSVEGVLRQVTAWLRETRLVELSRVEEEYF
jgi:uncharacterized protein YlxP (DUF503 family)